MKSLTTWILLKNKNCDKSKKKKKLNTVKNGVSTWTYCSVGVVVDYEDTTKAIQGHIGGLRLTLKEQSGEIK